MAAAAVRPRLLVVVGPTGSGKSRLGLEVAERLGGEIVSADAFAVYRGMDIGTDTPPPEDRRRVPHHLLDVADPRERFSAGQFLRAADRAIAAIAARGRVPVVVGGTHFYVRALLLGLFPAPEPDPALRARLRAAWERSPEAVRQRLERIDPEAAGRIAPGDRQRILRALEVYELTGRPISEHWRRHRSQRRYPALLVAPRRERDELRARIEARVGAMFRRGLVDEVRTLLAAGVPRSAHALKAIGYREVVRHLAGEWDLETTVERVVAATRQLAKRQLTWLRHAREGRVVWVAPAERGGAGEVLARWSTGAEGTG